MENPFDFKFQKDEVLTAFQIMERLYWLYSFDEIQYTTAERIILQSHSLMKDFLNEKIKKAEEREILWKYQNPNYSLTDWVNYTSKNTSARKTKIDEFFGSFNLHYRVVLQEFNYHKWDVVLYFPVHNVFIKIEGNIEEATIDYKNEVWHEVKPVEVLKTDYIKYNSTK